jgi:hypothetical protein
MAIQPFVVDDYEQWGNLVKRWARGTAKRPANLDELEKQLNKAKIGHSIPRDTFKTLKFIDEPSSVLVIRLPPADVLKQVEDSLAAGGDYMMPPFYARIFGKQPKISQAQKKTVHAERIGDYTVTFCA